MLRYNRDYVVSQFSVNVIRVILFLFYQKVFPDPTTKKKVSRITIFSGSWNNGDCLITRSRDFMEIDGRGSHWSLTLLCRWGIPRDMSKFRFDEETFRESSQSLTELRTDFQTFTRFRYKERCERLECSYQYDCFFVQRDRKETRNRLVATYL